MIFSLLGSPERLRHRTSVGGDDDLKASQKKTGGNSTGACPTEKTAAKMSEECPLPHFFSGQGKVAPSLDMQGCKK